MMTRHSYTRCVRLRLITSENYGMGATSDVPRWQSWTRDGTSMVASWMTGRVMSETVADFHGPLISQEDQDQVLVFVSTHRSSVLETKLWVVYLLI